MKKILILAIALAASTAVFAQGQASQPVQQTAQAAPQAQEVIVKIQQQAPELPKTTVVQKANEWVDFGKNVGAAMDAGLTSLTEHAEKFSKTDAGRFTMLVIAWKVAGRDAMELTERFTHVVVGIGILCVWIPLAVWFFRKNFMAHRVLIEKSGPFWNRTKKYGMVNDDMSDNRATSAWFFGIIAIIVTIMIVGIIL